MMNIEMHATLVHENEESYPLLVNQLDRSTKRDGYSYSYEMSHEDFYIYMLVHNSNHFRIGGMGARMVLDSYVFLKIINLSLIMTILMLCLKNRYCQV